MRGGVERHGSRRWAVAIVAAALTQTSVAIPAMAQAECTPPVPPLECEPGQLDETSQLCCGEGTTCTNPCWDTSGELGRDACRRFYDPPAPQDHSPVTLRDDLDGSADGHLSRLAGDPSSTCATVVVESAGYYTFYSRMPIADSCGQQMNESGFFSVAAPCNPEGHPVESNAGKRWVVLDSTNGASCECPDGCTCDGLDPEPCQGTCGDREACLAVEGPPGCCVPKAPTLLGTFLLVEGENQLCMHHWCSVHAELLEDGKELGFVTSDGCGASSHSIDLPLDQVIAVPNEHRAHECTWGCDVDGGECLPDPCETMTCPAFCKDGLCLEDNPCTRMRCRFGCHHGRCLEGPRASGPDADGDGYAALAECDDGDSEVHPGCEEECGNGTDDDCDGRVDESCTVPADAGPDADARPDAEIHPEPDAGPTSGPEAGADASRTASFRGEGGCGVVASAPFTGSSPRALAVLVGVGLGTLSIRRRRRRRSPVQGR